ncbi:hypothetical protein [Cellulosimicrobium marinum]|uniref:hypothetical protein n=1 Tax=Cellulosimicrobium marinum TaxID=1638992 RepID=UPI001E3485B3|nr:hypothetical protein [Cellulosimicrobium marinum]MCB7135596.1 hypothetical protein [Cellulosimicrobium marinum]
MRKYLAATAALSCALLLASCASTTDPSSSDTTTPDETTTTEAEAPEATVLPIEQSCAGFYDGGENSLATRVDETFPLTTEEVTDETVTELATTRDKIASVQRFADIELQADLNGIKAPFEAALTGVEVTTVDFEPALESFRTQCAEAGYEFAA